MPERTIDYSRAKDLWNEGHNTNEIAEILKSNSDCIRNALYRQGITMDRKITKAWLAKSGVGIAWDRACKMIREA